MHAALLHDSVLYKILETKDVVDKTQFRGQRSLFLQLHDLLDSGSKIKSFALLMVCLVNNLIYKATVTTTPGETKVY